MSEQKHTPGPWQLSAATSPGSTLLIWGKPGTGAPNSVIATVDHWLDGNPAEQDEASANARLIAASPTMYDYIARRAACGDEEAKRITEAIDAAVIIAAGYSLKREAGR
ncbi:MAG: hypothetical protein WC718_18190 [Phycisphaerales bacterium]|jgi:hypothetical protein